MRLLAQREYAVAELHGRLCGKWPGEEGIHDLADELVADLVNEGSLSDQRYVDGFIRSRRQRSQGPVKIRAELRQRRLSAELIDAALNQDLDYWVEVAAAWLARQHDGTLDYDDRARFYRRLINRGFSHEQAMQALDQHVTT